MEFAFGVLTPSGCNKIYYRQSYMRQEVCVCVCLYVYLCVLKNVYENGSLLSSVQMLLDVTLWFYYKETDCNLGHSASLSCFAWACAEPFFCSKLKNYLYLILATRKGRIVRCVRFHYTNTSMIVKTKWICLRKVKNGWGKIKSSHQFKNRGDMPILVSSIASASFLGSTVLSNILEMDTIRSF